MHKACYMLNVGDRRFHHFGQPPQHIKHVLSGTKLYLVAWDEATKQAWYEPANLRRGALIWAA